MRDKDMVEKVLRVLHSLYDKNKKSEVREPFHVLVSTVLSHRTKDETTDAATERVLSRCDTPEKLVRVPLSEIEDLIRPVGFYRVKAKRLKQISSILLEKFGGRVPDRIEELLSLPGVGRKTANCVLVFAYNKPALPVDTHVHRISNRLGLVNTRDPYKTEFELTGIIPMDEMGFFNSFMVKFGKEICKPIRPRCDECHLTDICDYYKTNIKRKLV